MEERFTPALIRLHELLQTADRELNLKLHFALIGGLAVSAWGIARATQDIDFLADSDPRPFADRNLRAGLKNFLERHGCRAEWRMGGLDDPIPILLRIDLALLYAGLGADVLWVHKRWQREALGRVIALKIDGRTIQVLHPEDLILMKLEAGGPQDLLERPILAVITLAKNHHSASQGDRKTTQTF